MASDLEPLSPLVLSRLYRLAILSLASDFLDDVLAQVLFPPGDLVDVVEGLDLCLLETVGVKTDLQPEKVENLPLDEILSVFP
jgi:hypothetical protein